MGEKGGRARPEPNLSGATEPAGPQVGEEGPVLNVARGDLQLPAMVLKEPELSNNLAVMARYAGEHGFLLAPHGKTTMAPELFRRQLGAGAWAITVANLTQAAVAFDAGAQRVLVANEVLGPADARAIVELLAPGGRSLLCLVDSVAGTRLLDHHLGLAGLSGRIDVLLELGAEGARAGARGEPEAVAVGAAVAASRHLRLVGVEGFEGALASARDASAVATVDEYLRALKRLALHLADEGAFPPGEPLVVSAGGSKYFDRVAELLGPSSGYGRHQARLVVRSGCYLVHDHGIYAQASPLGRPGERLLPALEVWAEVLSLPEPGLAIVGMGKRDVSYDAGLPVALRRASWHGGPLLPFSWATVGKLDDQHGYLALAERPGDGPRTPPLSVGDRVGFGLSHPCTALDKWRTVLLVDAEYNVLQELRTFFH